MRLSIGYTAQRLRRAYGGPRGVGCSADSPRAPDSPLLFVKLFVDGPLGAPQQRAQIDALAPSTRQVTTFAGEFLAPTQTLRLGSPGRLGNKPLAVVTAGESEPSWLKRQDELATLSSNSIHRVVKGATHESLLYERSDAQATSAAIDEVVAAVRNDRQLSR
jgi:hypothetical protein